MQHQMQKNMEVKWKVGVDRGMYMGSVGDQQITNTMLGSVCSRVA